MISATHTIGHTFIELKSVDSTNNYAMAMAHEGMAQHGTAVFAHEQTKGKGQRNKTWVSDSQKSIALSLFIEPFGLRISEAFYLSMATAVGVYNFFSKFAGDETKIKWPNDLYWRDRKAGGILIENIINSNGWKAAIVGMGINVNQTSFKAMAVKPVSLKQITGKDFSPVALARELCDHLNQAYELLQKEKEAIHKAYTEALFKKDEKVKLKKGNAVFEAIIKDVDKMGRLRIDKNGIEEFFEVGDVEWVWD